MKRPKRKRLRMLLVRISRRNFFFFCVNSFLQSSPLHFRALKREELLVLLVLLMPHEKLQPHTHLLLHGFYVSLGGMLQQLCCFQISCQSRCSLFSFVLRCCHQIKSIFWIFRCTTCSSFFLFSSAAAASFFLRAAATSS